MCLDQPLAQAFQLSVFTTPVSSLYNLVLATPEPWEQHSVTKKTLRRTRKRCTYALVVLLGIVGLLGVTLGITNRTNSRTESQTTAITATDGTTTGDANGNSDNLDGDTNNALSVSQTSHVVAWPVATSCLDEPFRPLVRVSCGATETVRIRTVQNANRTLTSDRTNVATCVPNQLANSARLAVAFGTVPAPCRGPSAPSKRCCPRRSLPTPPITLRTNQSCEGMLTEILDPIMGLNCPFIPQAMVELDDIIFAERAEILAADLQPKLTKGQVVDRTNCQLSRPSIAFERGQTKSNYSLLWSHC